MEFSPESFVDNPTWEALNLCRKADLLQIADQFGITVKAGSRKDDIKQAVVSYLLEKQILPDTEAKSGASDEEVETDPAEDVPLKRLQMKLKFEQLKLEHKRMEYQERESERQERQTLRLKELELEELRIKSTQQPMTKEFDLACNSRLVPPFNEREVDEYFILFEQVANTLKWPEEFRPLILKCVGRQSSKCLCLVVCCSEFRL